MSHCALCDDAVECGAGVATREGQFAVCSEDTPEGIFLARPVYIMLTKGIPRPRPVCIIKDVRTKLILLL